MGNLKDEMAFYRKYHFDPVNVVIHVLCIPLILLSTVWLMARWRLPPWVLELLPIHQNYHAYVNIPTPLSIIYATYYAYLDMIYGIPTGTLLIFSALKFSRIAPLASPQTTNTVWVLWGSAWVAQFIGHGLFEHRAPALLDSLIQAVVLAPFFAVFEVGHYLGFRTEILDSIDELVRPEVERFHAARRGRSPAKHTALPEHAPPPEKSV